VTSYPELADVGTFANYRRSGHEYWMATGHLHFAFCGELMPWDHLAGSLSTTEAGGQVRRINGGLVGPNISTAALSS
jgi:fructose-1,6-bisphosphatase/inositol monophosphatase family enzyme